MKKITDLAMRNIGNFRHILPAALLATISIGALWWGGHRVEAQSTTSPKIAFTTDRLGTGNVQIFLMDPDGSNQAPLPNPPLNTGEFDCAISPDGTKIAFTDSDDIYIMNSDGSNIVDLTNDPTLVEQEPRFSPDGSKITYITLQPDATWDVYLMESDGTNRVNLTQNIGTQDIDPTFSPDGTRIAFVSDRNNSTDIYTMDTSGGDLINLTNQVIPFQVGEPTYNADGTKIAYSSFRDPSFEIFIMNSDGSNQTQLTSDAFDEGRPTFSPDGARIAFQSDRSGNSDIWAMDSNGANLTHLTTDPAPDYFPFWGAIAPSPSPDPPVASGDSYSTNENSGLNVSAPGILQNDTSPDAAASLNPTLVSQPSHAGSFSFGNDGSFSYTPAFGFLGTDTFTYKVNDGHADSNVATVSITVVQAPIAVNDSYSVVQGGVLGVQASAGVLQNDQSPSGLPLTASLAIGPSHGSLTLGQDGSFTYTPDAGFSGDDTFAYQATDGNATSNLGFVTITVTPTNPSDTTPPVIVPTVSGTLGNNGWYTGNVQVSWTVFDNESSVTGTSGCGAQNVTSDTGGVTFTCSATSAGGISSQSVTVKRDATAPALAPAVSPNPVTQNAPATAAANASDALSGVASESCQPVDTSVIGGHSVSCTATDNAGNTATAGANYQVIPASSGIDIVFTRTLNGSTKIWGMRADGTGQVQLTTGTAVDASPSLSPDKSKIAFSRVVNNALNYEIFTMNVDGTGLTRLTFSSGLDSEPVWSPDGTKIAFTSDRYSSFLPNYEIVVTDAKGTNVKRLTNSPGLDLNPAWSPDGTRIAFSTTRYSILFNHFDIATMNSGDGSFVNRITNSAAIPLNLYPAWSPDGSKLVFTNEALGSGFSLHAIIYEIDASGTGLTRITFDPSNDSEPAWGADGRILFVSDRSNGSQIYSMEANGGKVIRLTNSGTNRSPAL